MNIDNIKILISDDSILARKQLKDIISTLGNPTYIEASDGGELYPVFSKNTNEYYAVYENLESQL